MCQNTPYFNKVYYYGTLERRYFCDVSDRDRQNIPFSRYCHRQSSLFEFCSGARYVELAGVHRSNPGIVEILVVVSAM